MEHSNTFINILNISRKSHFSSCGLNLGIILKNREKYFAQELTMVSKQDDSNWHELHSEALKIHIRIFIASTFAFFLPPDDTMDALGGQF